MRIIENNVSVCTTKAEGVDWSSSKSSSGSWYWFQRKQYVKKVCIDVGIDSLETSKWQDHALLQNKNGLDQACETRRAFWMSEICF
jgi:hypothetical protein